VPVPTAGGTEDSQTLHHMDSFVALGSNALFQNFPSWKDGFETGHLRDPAGAQALPQENRRFPAWVCSWFMAPCSSVLLVRVP